MSRHKEAKDIPVVAVIDTSRDTGKEVLSAPPYMGAI